MLQLRSGTNQHVDADLPHFLLWPEVNHFLNNNFGYFKGIEVRQEAKQAYFKRIFESHDLAVLNAATREWAIAWTMFACRFDKHYTGDLAKYLLKPSEHAYDAMVAYFMFMRSKQTKLPNIENYCSTNKLPASVPDPHIYDFFRGFLGIGSALDQKYIIKWEESFFSQKEFTNRFMHSVTTYAGNLRTLLDFATALHEELVVEVAMPLGVTPDVVIMAENYVPSQYPHCEKLIQDIIGRRPGLQNMLRKIFDLPGLDEDVATQIASLYISPELVWLINHNYPIPFWMYSVIAGYPLTEDALPEMIVGAP